MATRHVISLQGLGLALAFAGVGCSGNEGVRPPSYEPVSAVSEGNTYTLTVGDLRIAVDAALGARITEFSYRGTNVLTGPEVNIVSYGSTYWPSPQSSWCAAGVDCWPPISAIDNNPWTGSIDASTNVVTLTSGPATIAYYVGSEVTVSKRFTPVPANGAIDVTYTLTNTGGPPVFVAPWQVSRVAATGGLTFFGQGEGTVSYATGSDPAFVLTAAEGALWYQFAPLGARSKAWADGAGWLAHVTKKRLLYLLAFPDVPTGAAAPGEAEVEVFADRGAGDFLEVEAQGTLTAVNAGESLVWTVRWKLRELPAGVPASVGSGSLSSFAAAQLAE